MKKIKQIIQNSAGFTLAETLLAILILLMVSGIVATGIPASKNAYEKVVLASNAEVLLSTTMSELRNELGTARDVNVSDSNTVITYRNSYTGSESKLFKSSGGDEPAGTIMLQRYAGEGGSKALRLVSKKASDGLYVIYDTVDEPNTTPGIVTFHNLQVKRETSDTPLAEMKEFSVRVFSADKNG